MEQQITKKVWICDVCHRENGFHGTCELCGKEHCWICEYIGFNPLNIDICKDHQEDNSMKEIMQSFEKKYSKFKETIRNALKENYALDKSSTDKECKEK